MIPKHEQKQISNTGMSSKFLYCPTLSTSKFLTLVMVNKKNGKILWKHRPFT